jgi:nucleoside-diphosphate-sugar epimerase
MIVGHGMVARAFEKRLGDASDVTVFASGVSNSLETDVASFAREHDLLDHYLSNDAGRLVYFSSCGAIDDEALLTPYMKHKRRMESLVLSSPNGLVLRLPQVVGPTENPHTLTNFLRDRILSGKQFNIWANAERNLIDIEDVVAIGAALIAQPVAGSSVFSLAAAQSVRIPEIVKIFERILQRSACYVIEDKGTPLRIDTREAQRVAERLGIELSGSYIERVICKYYAPG